MNLIAVTISNLITVIISKQYVSDSTSHDSESAILQNRLWSLT